MSGVCLQCVIVVLPGYINFLGSLFLTLSLCVRVCVRVRGNVCQITDCLGCLKLLMEWVNWSTSMDVVVSKFSMNLVVKVDTKDSMANECFGCLGGRFDMLGFSV